jgi:hypothetical protein
MRAGRHLPDGSWETQPLRALATGLHERCGTDAAAMLPLLDDPPTAPDVVPALRTWARPAPQAVPALLGLAAGAAEPWLRG